MTQIPKHGYDLEERTAKFGENIVLFCKNTPKNEITRPLISQIAKKECHETKHWLRMLATAAPEKKEGIRVLWQECHELTLIFQSITTKVNAR